MSSGNINQRITAIERELLRRQQAGCPRCHGRGPGPGVKVIQAGEPVPDDQACPVCGALPHGGLVVILGLVEDQEPTDEAAPVDQ